MYEEFKSCPVCSKKCEKYYMFHINWYWRCPVCKIDADDPKYSKAYSYKISREWSDEDTQVSKRRPEIIAYVKDVQMATITVTKNFSSNDEAEVKINCEFKINGLLASEYFVEIFETSWKNTGTEEDMWVDIHRILFPTVLALSADDIKQEYLKLKLNQKYPSHNISVRL